MFDLNETKKYFEFKDRTRRNVSIITGILIGLYNLLSGIMITQLIAYALLGLLEYSILTFLLIFTPGLLFGAGILKAEIFLLNLLTANIEPEKYSYLRLVLFISIIVYLIIAVFYSLYMISDSLLKKFLPYQSIT